MLRLPLLSVLGLALSAPAFAANLDLQIASDGIGPVSITLRDVTPGKLPSIELPGPDGRSLRVDLDLADATVEGAPAYALTLQMTKRTPMGRKKVHEEISRPTLRFQADQDAMVFMGGEKPVPGTDPVTYEPTNYLKVSARIHTD